jgi:DivIVA domain-containing protein
MTMELTPSQLSGASFRTVRKGYDPDEVDSLLRDAAMALEQAQQQATAMEARARAAVARLQEQSEHAPQAPGTAGDRSDAGDLRVGPDQAEMISRTLLLAQRTADTTIAEAEAAAERIRTEARDEADMTLDSTREMSAQIVEEARAEARKANEAERLAAANEVESLKARREFLLGDVDQLETFLVDQRERLRGAARQIEALCDRVPSGLGEVAAPVLSASDDEPGDDTGELFVPPEARLPFADVDQLARALGNEPLTADGPDTGELDATQPVTAPDAPDLPVRGEGDARDGDGGVGPGASRNGTPPAEDDSASI